MYKIPEKIEVKVTKSSGWYKKGDIHEVYNHISFDYCGGEAYFERGKGGWGIKCTHCEIITKAKETPEYTMDELFEKLGETFKIKGA